MTDMKNAFVPTIAVIGNPSTLPSRCMSMMRKVLSTAKPVSPQVAQPLLEHIPGEQTAVQRLSADHRQWRAVSHNEGCRHTPGQPRAEEKRSS